MRSDEPLDPIRLGPPSDMDGIYPFREFRASSLMVSRVSGFAWT